MHKRNEANLVTDIQMKEKIYPQMPISLLYRSLSHSHCMQS